MVVVAVVVAVEVVVVVVVGVGVAAVVAVAVVVAVEVVVAVVVAVVSKMTKHSQEFIAQRRAARLAEREQLFLGLRAKKTAPSIEKLAATFHLSPEEVRSTLLEFTEGVKNGAESVTTKESKS